MNPTVDSMEDAREEIPHDEYYFYVSDHEDEPRLLHLDEDMVSDMREMMLVDFPKESGHWFKKVSLEVEGEGMWFVFYPDSPSNSEFRRKNVFGDNKRVFGSVFKDRVWFDSGFLCASTGPPADKERHHYKRIREEVVLDEHEEQYVDELLEWEEGGGWDTEWMDLPRE